MNPVCRSDWLRMKYVICSVVVILGLFLCYLMVINKHYGDYQYYIRDKGVNIAQIDISIPFIWGPVHADSDGFYFEFVSSLSCKKLNDAGELNPYVEQLSKNDTIIFYRTNLENMLHVLTNYYVLLVLEPQEPSGRWYFGGGSPWEGQLVPLSR